LFEPASVHVQDFENAAKVIVIGNKIFFSRADQAHIAEGGLFQHVPVVGTDKQSGIDVIAQIQIRKPGSDERFAVAGGGKDISVSLAFKLEDIGIGDGKGDFLRIR